MSFSRPTWRATALTATVFVAACAAPSVSPFSGGVPQTAATAAKKADAVPNQLILRAKAGKTLKSFVSARGLKVLDTFTTDQEHVLVETNDPAGLAKAAKSNPDIDVTSPNLIVTLNVAPNDPMYPQQWSHQKVGAEAAWEKTMGDPNLIVAVVDTGVDYNHPDLKGKVIKGLNNTGEGPKDDPIDGFGHGTHVAGIIAATANNNEGVAGIAPNVKILAEKVLSSKGSGNLFTISAGVQHAVKAGAKIVNLSLGGPAAQDPISAGTGQWATKRGALLVAAAGNSANAVGTPARYSDYYMAVAASDENDGLAKFSCFGKELSVAAPGVKIMNTTPTYDCPLTKLGYSKNYAALQGTSMATPLVAGLAALVWSAHPSWTWQQVRLHIEKTATDVGAPGFDVKFGNGRVNAAAALQ